MITACDELEGLQREMYAAFGHMAHEAQLFEFILANVLAIVYGPPPRLGSGARVRNMIDENYKKTAGTLKRELGRVLGDGSKIISRVAAVVTTRNTFMHSFFRDRAGELKETDGLRKAALKLEQAAAEFRSCGDELGELYFDWLRKHGVEEPPFPGRPDRS